MVSVHPSLLRSCAWNPEITDCCNAQVKVESCLYIDRLSYCFIWSNGRSNFVTCTVCVTTSADDILPRHYLCRTLLCSSDRDHKTQRSAVTKARTDDATVQHVVFYWRFFKKKNTARKRRCLSLVKCQLPRLGSPHVSSLPLPLAPHVGRWDNSPGLLFTLLPLLFCDSTHSRL